MIKMILGAALSAVAMFVIGFIFWGPTGLSSIAVRSLDDTRAAAVSSVLSANVPANGTYLVPNDRESPAQTAMYGNGPIATVHYNSSGFVADPTVFGVGLIFNFAIALLIGLAMVGIDGRVTDFGSRARVAVLIALAGSGFVQLSEPIYWHHDWAYAIYAFVADGLMLAAAGLIFAWILPRPAASAAPEDAPAEA
jgi:hypothetical protein